MPLRAPSNETLPYVRQWRDETRFDNRETRGGVSRHGYQRRGAVIHSILTTTHDLQTVWTCKGLTYTAHVAKKKLSARTRSCRRTAGRRHSHNLSHHAIGIPAITCPCTMQDGTTPQSSDPVPQRLSSRTVPIFEVQKFFHPMYFLLGITDSKGAEPLSTESALLDGGR